MYQPKPKPKLSQNRLKPTEMPKQERTSIKPSTLLAPVPVVLVSCKGKPDGARPNANMMTVAWAGTVCSDPPMLAISIRKSRWSYEQIKESREFVVNLVSKELLNATDFCGVKSGAEIDKFKECQLTPVAAQGLHLAPAVAQSPLTLSCRLSQIVELGSHDLFIAKIVAVEAADSLMKANKICLDRADLVAYAHGEYYALGPVLGFFGFSVASAAVIKRRMPVVAEPQTNWKERSVSNRTGANAAGTNRPFTHQAKPSGKGMTKKTTGTRNPTDKRKNDRRFEKPRG